MATNLTMLISGLEHGVEGQGQKENVSESTKYTTLIPKSKIQLSDYQYVQHL